MESGFDMNQIMHYLSSFGLSPENLGPERLEKLQSIASTIDDPSKISPEMSRHILDTLGVNIKPVGVQQPKESKKIGRNEPCMCGSNLKYKKCHLLNENKTVS